MRPPWQPKRAAAALYEGYQAPLSVLGNFERSAPLSTHGPMCQGSLVSFSTIAAHKLAVIGHLRLGAQALQMPVLALSRAYARRDRSGDENHDPRRQFEVRNEPCPLCNGCLPLGVFVHGT
jgi:hypothetical protein